MRGRGSIRTMRRAVRRPGLCRLTRRLRAEDGNALVEFVALSVILLIPTLYLVLTLGSVQGAVFAADVIARDAARIHATERDPAQAQGRADAMVRMTLEDHGIRAQDAVTLHCSKDPCASPGGEVTADVSISVPIPGLGPLLGQDGPVRVGGEHVVQVDQFRAPGEPAPETSGPREDTSSEPDEETDP